MKTMKEQYGTPTMRTIEDYIDWTETTSSFNWCSKTKHDLQNMNSFVRDMITQYNNFLKREFNLDDFIGTEKIFTGVEILRDVQAFTSPSRIITLTNGITVYPSSIQYEGKKIKTYGDLARLTVDKQIKFK